METLSHADWSQINDIVTVIHDSSDLSLLRSSFLSQIQELVPYQKAFFDLGNNKGGQHTFFDPISVGMLDSELDDYYRHFEPLDYAVWALIQNIPLSYRDSDLVSDEFRNKSRFCNEWLRPMNVLFCGGSCIVQNSILYGSVTLMRSESLGDFTRRELSILDILNKHLCLRFHQLYPNGNTVRNSDPRQSELVAKFRLTNREYDVLQLLIAGLHNNQISMHLCISDNTTKKHTSHIFEKLNVSSRSQLIKTVLDSCHKI